MSFLGIDIGGSWIKAAISGDNTFGDLKVTHLQNLRIQKIQSPLSPATKISALTGALEKLAILSNAGSKDITGIGVSTAGIVDYAGRQVLKAAAHLDLLKNSDWVDALEQKFHCPVSLINDGDAAVIGIAELGKFHDKGSGAVGVMTVGTGLGFSIWKNGRRWRPGKAVNLLGSIRTPSGFFDDIASVSRLASMDIENNLIKIFTDPYFEKIRQNYAVHLGQIINTAAILYDLDEIMICGGLADAVTASAFPLEKNLNLLLADTPAERNHPVRVEVVKEGNLLQLIGALSIAKGEAEAQSKRVTRAYNELVSEKPYQDSIQLQNLSAKEILEILWQAEQEAGENLKEILPLVVTMIETISERLDKGGRIIYVGAGTSGRIAAMDSIEIPCTFGFPKNRIITLIAGGVTNASMEIESDFEEDASAVPEMLLLDISSNDIVIGISVSGTAYFVQSALAFAKSRGSFSAIIQGELPKEKLPFCDMVIPLFSGGEVVAGSTRMKAGTSTKKILNFISTTVMIKMGKVTGSFMVNVACINNKLVKRAQHILKVQYDIDEDESLKRLKEADMKLTKAIENIHSSLNG